MEVSRIIAEIDSQISKLQQARALLSETSTPVVHVKRAGRGRPKGSKNAVNRVATVASTRAVAEKKTTKRKLSPEGRKKIAEAMKKRWAERRRLAAK